MSAEVEAFGVMFKVIGRYPIAGRWSVMGYVGAYSWNTREDLVQSGVGSLDQNNGSDVVYGAGIEWDVHRVQHTVLRTELKRVTVDRDRLAVMMLTASADYRF